MRFEVRDPAADRGQRHAELARGGRQGCRHRPPPTRSTWLRADPSVLPIKWKDDYRILAIYSPIVEGISFAGRSEDNRQRKDNDHVTHPDPRHHRRRPGRLAAAARRQSRSNSASVPNLFRLVANSPAALEGYLGLSGALGKGKLPAADPRADRAGDRRDQRLQLLPLGAHLSRQEPRQARRRRDRGQPQRRLERSEGRRGRALCRQGRHAPAGMSATPTCGPSRLPATTTRR